MANGGRKFLIEFMVESEQAVKASDDLAQSLKGVSGQVGDTNEQITDIKVSMQKAGGAIGASAQAVTQGVAGVSGGATMLDKNLGAVFTSSSMLAESTGHMAHGMSEAGESFGHTAKRGLYFIKTLLGIEHLYDALEQHSPVKAMLSLFMIFVKFDHFLGGHKKHVQGITAAQQLYMDKQKAANSVAGMSAKILREQAAQMLAASQMATTEAEAQGLRAKAGKATTKASDLEKQALEQVVGQRLAHAAALADEEKKRKKMTIFQKIGVKMDKLGLKNLVNRVRASKIMRTGILKDLGLGKKATAQTKARTKAEGALGDKLGLVSEAGGEAAEVGGSGAGAGMAALAAALPAVIASLPILAFGAMTLVKALKPLGRVFGRVFNLFDRFIEIIAIPIMKPLSALADALDDVGDLFEDIAEDMEPLLEDLGEVLSGPIADAGKVFVGLIKDVIEAAGGMEAFTQPIKDVTASMGDLMVEMKPLLNDVMIAMKPVLVDLVKGMAEFFRVGITAFGDFVKTVLPELLAMLPDALKMIADVAKFGLALFKQWAPLIKWIAWAAIKVMGGAFKAVSFIIDGVAASIDWLGSIGEKLGIWFESFWNDLKTGAESLFAPFKSLGDMLSGIGDIAQKVKGFFFGSGLWGLPEAMVPVMSDFHAFGGLLDKIGDKADDVKASFKGMAVTADNSTPAQARIVPTDYADPSGASPLGPRVVEVASGGTAEPATGRGMSRPLSRATQKIEVSIPVTVDLDGMTIARALKEAVFSIGRERFMNDPGADLRGVEGA